jgi:uncharacterized protein DUF2799
MKTTLLLSLILLLNACATMNEAECINADWKIIGIQDGSKGKLPAYIGEHQSACSQYNVTPILETYMEGHRIGVQQYCTDINGYNLGENGSTYNGVCPANLEENFLIAYNHGYEHYILNNQIEDVISSISNAEYEIDNIKNEVSELEEKLISDDTSKEQREILLQEIKEHQEIIRQLETEIEHHLYLKSEVEEKLFIHNQNH